MAFGPKDNGVIVDATLRATSKLHPTVSNPPLHILPPSSGSGCLKGDPFDNSIIDLQYRTWISKYPSALSMFDQIVEVAKAKQIVMFLDYDGTLSPIVKDPETAFMSEAMRNAVRSLASCFPTAIISGRCREKVFDFIGLSELYYAGSHGMDIMGPAQGCNGIKASGEKAYDGKGNEVVVFQPAKEFKPIMDEVFIVLEEIVRKVNGAKIDHNKFSISVHFRCVQEEEWVILAEEVLAAMQSFPSLRLTQGRKVLEVRPSIAWDKGKALEYLLNALGLEGRSDIFPVYIGDDRTDEDAFKVLNKQNHGLGILVSTAVKETNAQSSLRDPSEVLEFLQRLYDTSFILEYVNKRSVIIALLVMAVFVSEQSSKMD
ncbi:hypothetical protein GOP47_0028484 [Adiantum capillus-veneris]|nr:hypothetical protein GOP47_0028484 [Adiantum capillus-veneris]